MAEVETTCNTYMHINFSDDIMVLQRATGGASCHQVYLPARHTQSVHSAGTKILLYIPASDCVCVHPQLSCALSYVIVLLCHYSHEHSGSLQAKVCQASLHLCCLKGGKVAGMR